MKWILGTSMVVVAMSWIAVPATPAAKAAIDEASLRFLPPETQGLAVVDLAALRNAPLLKNALKSNPRFPPSIQEFTNATGIDASTDIDKITLAKIGLQAGLFVIQGRIDKFKVEQFLISKGKQPDAYLGQTLYQDRDGAIAVFDNVLILGQVDAVKKAIDQVQLPGSKPLRSDLLAGVENIDAGDQVWAVGDFSVNDLSSAGIPGQATPALELLKSLQGGTYEMRIDNDIHMRAVAKFADANSARNIEDLTRGALAIAKLQMAQKQPDLVHVLDGIQISSNGATLTVQVEEPGNLFSRQLHQLR